jgi:hypothetical protein
LLHRRVRGGGDRRMIYDCVTFYDEFDLLEIRLRALEDVVDVFVVCEAPFTFRGKPKPLYLRDGLARFERWKDRLVVLTYPGPAAEDPWKNEWGQRDYLIEGLRTAAPDDLVLLGDCDEIPDPRNAARRPSASGGIVGHIQSLCLGFLNVVCTEPWIGTRAIEAGSIARYQTLSGVRLQAIGDLERVTGGWHLSSLGGAAILAQKMQSYSHSDFDVPYYRDQYRLDLLFRGAHDNVIFTPLDPAYPAFLLEEARWSVYIMPEPTTLTAPETLARQHAHGCFAYVPPDVRSVYGVTPAGGAWQSAGNERFGDRFRGAAGRLSELPALDPGSWVVVDGLEAETDRALRLLHASGAGVVAFARNAQSFKAFDAAVGGAAFAAGKAFGSELADRIASIGWEAAVVDRLATPGIHAIFSQMPERVSGAEVGRFRFAEIERARLQMFLTEAFVFRIDPRATGA